MSIYLPPKIMIVDSDVICCTYLSNSLERNGFSVISCHSGDDAIKHLEKSPPSHKPNLITIDDEVQDIQYMELYTNMCNETLNTSPIILILKDTNCREVKVGTSKVLTDYVIKPFTQADLMSKVKILLSKSKTVLQEKVLSCGDIQINIASYKVSRGGRELHLGPTEFKLLQCFMESPSKVFSRQELVDYVLMGRENVELRTIDVHINRLRTALKNPWDDAQAIRTVRAIGYCLSTV